MAIQSINLGKELYSQDKLVPVAATPTKSIKGGKQERSASQLSNPQKAILQK